MATPIHVSDDTFDAEVLHAPVPVVVDFWAVWCGPCRMIAPVVEELAAEYDGKVRFAKLDVDENPDTSARYGVMNLPTLLIFKAGKPVDQIIGAVPRREVKRRVEAQMAA